MKMRKSGILPNKRKALAFPKSSHWMRVLCPHLLTTAWTNSSIKSSYSCPLTRFCLRPMYKGSFSIFSVLVPTSKVMGNVWCGLIPARAVYNDSLPIGIPIPQAPKSPRPKIRSPSVTTITRTSD